MQTKRPPINYGRQTKIISFTTEAKGISTNELGQEIGKIEAFGAIYGNEDDGGDRIIKGAFDRTVKNSKSRAKSRNNPYLFKMLWNHSQDDLIGGWYDVDPSDPKGLRCWGDVLLSTQRGREFYELALAKMADQYSIIYDIIRGDKDNPGARYDEKGVRELLQLRLFTIDPVSLAMNDETDTVNVKSNEGKQMEDKLPQRKTLLEHYNDAMARDLLEDWKCTILDPLTCAMFDAFTIGDQPEQDIAEALDVFKTLVLTKFVPQAIECNLSQYLTDNGYSYTPGLDLMQDGPDDGMYAYGYMSRRSGFARKAGKPISATNQGHIDDHVAALHDIANNAVKAIKAVHAQADSFASTMSGGKDDDETEDGKKPDDKQDGKSMESALKLLQGLRTNR